MMKKFIGAFFALMMSSSLYAIDWNSQSLVGFELGYGQMKVTGPNYKNNFVVAPIGIKIGAKNENSRLFLSTRYLYIPDFDLSMAYGAEFQYLTPASKIFDFFLGVNGGLVTMRFNPNNFNADARSNRRDLSSYYMGADTGLNVNFSSYFTLELGARYMYMNIDHIKNFEKYTIKPITQGYISFIYKYYSTK